MRLWIGSLSLVGVLSVSVVDAEATQTALTLSEATARVLDSNPQLQAADFDARAAAARIRQQSQSTPYTVGVDLENFAGSGDISGVDGLETTLSLGRVLEFGDKARQRGDVATLEAGLLRHDQDARRLDLLAETARRFLALARAQAERDLAGQRVALMQRTARAVDQRHRLGKAPAAERSRTQIELARAELALEETDHLLVDGRHRLAVMWGAFPPDVGAVRADVFRLEPEPEFAALDRSIERNPALARLTTVERLGAARVALAQARARPDPELSAGVRHLNASDDVGMVLSLRLPLGSAGRAASHVDEAEALAAREPLLAQDRRLALRATLYGLHQELRHARDRFETYRDRVIPAAEQAVTDYSEGYAAGRYSLLELSAAQTTLLEARRELLAAAIEHHAARIEIDRLVGAEPVKGVAP
jgi:cobalt-zinc-cadmium efflux system outer membrane protein